MVVPRLLVLSLLIAASVTPATAQFSPAAPSTANPFSSQLPPNGSVPPLKFGAIPTQNPQLGAPFNPSPLTVSPFKPYLSKKALDAISQGKTIGPMQIVRPDLLGKVLLLPRQQATCYAIRSYDFTGEDPASDATRFTGSSTCQSVASVKFKAVADPHAGVPR